MITKILLLIKNYILQNKTLSLILLIAVVLRFVGTNPGYHPYHQDEGMSYSSAIEMIRNLNLDPARYDYPSLVPLVHAVVYVFLFIPLFIIKSLIFSLDDLPTKGKNLVELWQQVVIQNQQTHVLFWGRYLTAAFSVGVVFLVYKISEKLFQNKYIGLVAAFLTAVNFRQVLNSHLALPDIYNAFFLLLAFWFALKILEAPSKKNYLLAGITVGLAFSNKFQLFSLFPFLLAHICVVRQTKRKGLKELFVAGMAASLVVLVINPYHLIRWEDFQGITSYNVLKYGVGAKIPSIYAFSYLYHIGIGKLASIAVLLGIIMALLKSPFRTLLLVSVVLPFFYIFAYYTRGGYYTRNFVTIIPFLLIFAALFIVEFWNFLSQRLSMKKSFVYLGIATSAFLISYVQIKHALINSYYFSKPWGFELAHQWAQANIPEGAKVVSHPWDKYPRDKNLEIIPLEISTVFSLAEMQEEGADFGFINMDWLALSSYWWMNRNTSDSLRFWKKPDDLLSNTYGSVVAQELASWSVAQFVKPWQAPDMNFLIVKIPALPKIGQVKKIGSFSFKDKESLSGWSLIDGSWGEASGMLFDPEVGNKEPGSLKITSGSRQLPLIMATTPAFLIEENRAFVIEGWIRSINEIKKSKRDGILRVDFYESDPGRVNLETRSLYTAVSSRFYGDNGWHRKEIIVVPPAKTKFIRSQTLFMTVSVQTNSDTDFWFDDINVYETIGQFENPRDNPPYFNFKIPEDILFPYSQGGL